MKNLTINLLKGPGHLPIHLQIMHCLEYAIGFGQLPPGTRLPSVRELATELQVAPNTVARAYAESCRLTRMGYVPSLRKLTRLCTP